MTQAGPEIGVASTKAFTTQLTALLIFTLALARHNGLRRETIREVGPPPGRGLRRTVE